MLYPEPYISAALQARAEASKALSGSGVGFGLLGTPSLSFAAEAAALGLLSAWLSNSANATAQDKLKRAQKFYSKAKLSGRYFDVGEVDNVNESTPTSWCAIGGYAEAVVSIENLSRSDKKEFCEIHNFRHGLIIEPNAIITVPIKYIGLDEEFFNSATYAGELLIRWSSVETIIPDKDLTANDRVEKDILNHLGKSTFVKWRSIS